MGYPSVLPLKDCPLINHLISGCAIPLALHSNDTSSPTVALTDSGCINQTGASEIQNP